MPGTRVHVHGDGTGGYVIIYRYFMVRFAMNALQKVKGDKLSPLTFSKAFIAKRTFAQESSSLHTKGLTLLNVWQT